MYEQFRNDVLVQLSRESEGLTTSIVLHALDLAASKYDFQKKSTDLMIIGDGIPEIAKIYLVVKKMAGLSDETLENYRLILSSFFRSTNKLPQQINANDIRMWLYSYQKSRGVSNRTLDKYREYICRFFQWAQDEEYISANPSKGVEPIKYEIKQRESLTQVELEYLRLACENERDLAIIETLYSTGCRVSELSIIKKRDIDWHENTVHLFGKGKKHRFSFLNAKAEVAIKVYLATRSDDCEYLFTTLRKPYKKMSKDAIEKALKNIVERMPSDVRKHITPHILRHTTATIALNGGMPIEDISKLLGHESVDTTMIYAKTSMEDVRMRHKKYVV